MHYGKHIGISELRNLAETTRTGSNLKYLADASEAMGLRSLPVKIDLKQLREAPLPCILHWDKNHFVVLYKIKKGKFYISDPAYGLINYTTSNFLDYWIGEYSSGKGNEGICLLLEPTQSFCSDSGSSQIKKMDLKFILAYFKGYKAFLLQLFIGLLAGSILQLIFPFLTQAIVDIGIRNQNINFVYLILMAQMFLFMGRTGIELIRGWILLHIGSRIKISMLSDFFIKLMRLPMAFFDTRLTGDLLLRIQDHERVEKLLTASSLSVLFSIMSLVIFGAVLMYYSLLIFVVFILGTLLYVGWVLGFLKKRRDIDYREFNQASEERSKVIEMINGMQDIKLHNAEKEFRWDWEHIQAKLFKLSINRMTWDQYQNIGAGFINELKNIIITALAAKLVIDGHITLGMMLAISFIIGQLNAPVVQLMEFSNELQDARLALKRLSEIHFKTNEDADTGHLQTPDGDSMSGITLNNVTFRYPSTVAPTLKQLSLKIPKNKTTAIVGVSGSGKTTLMKILLKFYKPQEGSILVGPLRIDHIKNRLWRDKCGVVMQEGFVFSSTIAHNIAMTKSTIDMTRLIQAVSLANIKMFIEALPMSYDTKIGAEGIGLSTGQKQRILIARAIYKNPGYLFFDEATSALDAKNERKIMENLNSFFRKRTVVIIAHRLSTVKHADQIVVLEKGRVKEIGTHTELVDKKGAYYELVRNQLEIGG
jgi:ATP-binding cassette subfamily B protein